MDLQRGALSLQRGFACRSIGEFLDSRASFWIQSSFSLNQAKRTRLLARFSESRTTEEVVWGSDMRALFTALRAQMEIGLQGRGCPFQVSQADDHTLVW